MPCRRLARQSMLFVSVLSAVLVMGACERAGKAASREEGPGGAAPSAQATPGLNPKEPDAMPHSDVPPPSRAMFTDGACDYEGWIGKPLDEAAVKATGKPYRILTKDSVVTMDHAPSRLNVVHDHGKVIRVWCG